MKRIKGKEILLILIIYLIISFILQLKANDLYIKIVNPAFWLFCGVYYYRENKEIYIRFSHKNIFIKKLLLWMLIYLIVFFDIGFITGYGRNPYDNTLFGIFNNITRVIIPISGIEILRSYFINKNKKNKKIYIIMTLLLFFIETNFYYYLYNWANKKVIFKYLCSTTLPLLGINFLSSYLVSIGSFELSLIYRLIDKLVLVTLPIVPNMNWFVSGAFSLVFMTIIYFMFKYRYHPDDSLEIEKNNKKSFGYPLTLTFCILLILFMLGAFKYEPIAIMSNSMVPTYSRGDVVIYEKISQDKLKKLKKGSIIIYKIGDMYIAHRINKVIINDEEVKYITKGDNNTTSDIKLVATSDIKGVYIGSFKYIGYPTVWLNEFFSKK